MSRSGPKAGGPDYLWAFVRRTDARPGSTSNEASTALVCATLPMGVGSCWEDSVERRIDVIERAAESLGRGGDLAASEALLAAARAAREELGRPRATIAVAGQHNELWSEPARGLGLVHASGPAATWWLAAPLLAGNAVVLVASPVLAGVVAALCAAGVPETALASVEAAPSALLILAESPRVAFVATDAAGALVRETWARLGRTAEGQRWLKALLSPLEGPQPGEPGFMRRFAWSKTIAVRTLRHGADLGLELDRTGG